MGKNRLFVDINLIPPELINMVFPNVTMILSPFCKWKMGNAVGGWNK
jgi:hypothetical protein